MIHPTKLHYVGMKTRRRFSVPVAALVLVLLFDEIVWVTMTDQGPRITNLLMDGIYDENVRVLK